MTAAAPPSHRSELLAGAAGGAVALPLVLTLGVLAFAATGPQAAALGLGAALAATVAGGLVMAALARTPLPTAGPSSATALILAALIARLVQDPALSVTHPDGVLLLMSLCGTAVAGAGAVLLLMSLLRLGTLARLVPQPVLAGFMNGVALLILVAQAAPLLGLPADAWSTQGLAALAQAQSAPLLLGAATMAAVWALRRWAPRWPAALLALLLGVALAAALQALDGPALPRLPAVQALSAPPVALPGLGPAASLWWAAVQQHASTLALTALLLALLGGLESLLSIAATETTFGFRSEPDRELRALGFANLASGALAGMPVVYLRLGGMTIWQAGGRTRRAAVAAVAVLALVLLAGRALVPLLPLAVLAGLMVMTALALIDGWTRQLAQQWWAGQRDAELQRGLAVVAVVCAVTLWQGVTAGVGVGLLLSVLLFLYAMHRSPLRARFEAAAQPSRRVYPPALEAVLAPRRWRVEVMELEGALFFGNAGRLEDEAETTLPAHRVLVLDLRRVSSIDASGAAALQRLARRLRQRGGELWLAGAAAGQRHEAALRAYGVVGGPGRPGECPAYLDSDRAIEAAELHLLAEAGHPLHGLAVPLEHCSLLQGLNAEQRARLHARMQPHRLAAGERLFAEGDPGTGLYVLSEGSITIVSRADAQGLARQRFVSFSPGMTLGETAVLDGGGRTADAVADLPSRLYELPAEALHALQHEEPELAAVLYRNLAQHLSARLRAAAEGWRQAVG